MNELHCLVVFIGCILLTLHFRRHPPNDGAGSWRLLP